MSATSATVEKVVFSESPSLKACACNRHTTPVDADVLQRARAPLLETYDNLLKTHAGWMGLVDRAQTQPDRLQRYLSGQEVIRSLTPQDIYAMARRYLDPAQRLEIVVLPQAGEQAAAGS